MKQENQSLLYKLDDRPSFIKSLIISIQHVLAMFVSITATPLIIARAVSLGPEDTAFFISMALVASGISTFIQVKKIGPVGSGLLSTQGTSFSFLPVFIAAAKAGGMALALGTSLITAPAEALISRAPNLIKKLFPPQVTGTVVLLIGIVLIKVGIINLAGGFAAADFASVHNILLGITVMAIIIVLTTIPFPFIRSTSIFLGILIGYIISIMLGLVDFSFVSETQLIQIPRPFYFGLSFNLDFILAFILIYIVTTVETIGDITATCACSGEPVQGEIYERRVRGGILGDSINSILAALLNSPPNTTFSQNNGIIQLTGVASRKIGYFTAAILILLGIFPKVAAFVMTIPMPVIGGAMLIIFGIIAAAGIRIISMSQLDHKTMIILSVSLGIGAGITYLPEIFTNMPEIIRNLFSSGIASGGLAAVLLNIILPQDLS